MIERLQEHHIPFMCHVLRECKAESPTYNDWPEDAEYVMNNLKLLLASSTFVGFTDEKLRGVILGSTSAQWFSPRVEAYEHLLFVYEEHRGGPFAVRLIKEFESWARARTAYAVNVGSTLGINDKRVESLYMRLGYTRNGYGLTKRLSNV